MPEYEILQIEEYPQLNQRGEWIRTKFIRFKVAEGTHEISMPAADYTAKKAHSELSKAAKEILETFKPKGD